MIPQQRKCITTKRSYVVSLHNREQRIRKFKFDSELLPHFGFCSNFKQEGHDGPVSLHWLIHEIHSYQTLHCLGIGLKHKTPYKD